MRDVVVSSDARFREFIGVCCALGMVGVLDEKYHRNSWRMLCVGHGRDFLMESSTGIHGVCCALGMVGVSC